MLIKLQQKGFTLIELLVVIGIIGILITVTIVTLNPFGQISKARDAQRKSDLKQIQTALELYSHDTDGYPTAADWTALMTELKNGNYLKQDIVDKAGNYVYIQDGLGYRMFAGLDNVTDPQACTADGTACASVPTGITCGTDKACNYEVKSSNL